MIIRLCMERAEDEGYLSEGWVVGGSQKNLRNRD